MIIEDINNKKKRKKNENKTERVCTTNKIDEGMTATNQKEARSYATQNQTDHKHYILPGIGNRLVICFVEFFFHIIIFFFSRLKNRSSSYFLSLSLPCRMKPKIIKKICHQILDNISLCLRHTFVHCVSRCWFHIKQSFFRSFSPSSPFVFFVALHIYIIIL